MRRFMSVHPSIHPKHSNKKGICNKAFDEWKVKIMEKVDEKIKYRRKGPLQKWRQIKQVLQDSHCSQELQDLHDKFVITPVDKASNNIALTYKPDYINTILSELNNESYQQAGTSDTVIKDQVDKNKELKCIVSNEDKKLPIM